MILEMALKMFPFFNSEFQASVGWMKKFMKRLGLFEKIVCFQKLGWFDNTM